MIWVENLGVGWWTSRRIRTKFCIIGRGIVCLILCQSHFAYLGEGWQTGEWIEAKFMHHKLGTLYAYTYVESF